VTGIYITDASTIIAVRRKPLTPGMWMIGAVFIVDILQQGRVVLGNIGCLVLRIVSVPLAHSVSDPNPRKGSRICADMSWKTVV
jgi:hypothetical protein